MTSNGFAGATAMTTRRPEQSSACSKPRSSTGWGRGNPRIRSNGNPAIGRLVQQGVPARTSWLHHANRSRGEVQTNLASGQNRRL